MTKIKFLARSSSALIISLSYLLIGSLCIYLTTTYLKNELSSPNQIEMLNIQTGIRFSLVTVSTLLLYFFIRHYYHNLQLTAEGYFKLFNENPNPMWVFEVKTLRFLAVNHAALDKYGYTKEEFLSMTIKDIRPEEEIDRLLTSDWKMTFDRSGIWKHRLKNGETIHVEISTHFVEYEGQNARLAVAWDVTDTITYERKILEFNHTLEKRVNERTKDLHDAIQEQATLTEELENTNEQLIKAQDIIHKQAHELVRQNGSRFNQVLKSIKDVVWSGEVKEGELKIDLMSPAATEILGFTREDYINNPSIWINTIAEQDRERVMNALLTIGKHDYIEVEYCIRQPENWVVKYVLNRIWVETGPEANTYQLNGIISDISEIKKQEEEKSDLVKQFIVKDNQSLYLVSLYTLSKLYSPPITLS
jgi:PAS domain S-box-containing protein